MTEYKKEIFCVTILASSYDEAKYSSYVEFDYNEFMTFLECIKSYYLSREEYVKQLEDKNNFNLSDFENYIINNEDDEFYINAINTFLKYSPYKIYQDVNMKDILLVSMEKKTIITESAQIIYENFS